MRADLIQSPFPWFQLPADGDERRLWTWLQGAAVGREQAVTQDEAAKRLGWTVRRLQAAMEALNLAHFPVASVCSGDPKGIFIAVTQEELRGFQESLRGRLVTQYRRLRAVRRTLPMGVGAAEKQSALF
jgi:hypothetical protein